MARVFHPKTFPECSPSILIPESLERSMEAYWRVKKWKLDAVFTYGEDSEDVVSLTLDVQNPQYGDAVTSEADLVCPKSRKVEQGMGIDLAFAFLEHRANAPFFDCSFGEFGNVDGPYSSAGGTTLPEPMTFHRLMYLN